MTRYVTRTRRDGLILPATHETSPSRPNWSQQNGAPRETYRDIRLPTHNPEVVGSNPTPAPPYLFKAAPGRRAGRAACRPVPARRTPPNPHRRHDRADLLGVRRVVLGGLRPRSIKGRDQGRDQGQGRGRGQGQGQDRGRGRGRGQGQDRGRGRGRGRGQDQGQKQVGLYRPRQISPR